MQLAFQSANCGNVEKTADYLLLSCHHVCFNGYFTGDYGLAGYAFHLFQRTSYGIITNGTDIFTSWMPFLTPNQQCQSIEGYTSFNHAPNGKWTLL